MTYLAFCERVGVRLESGQEAFARVAFDNDMPASLPDAVRERMALIFGPNFTSPPRRARAVVAAVCGARSGKSYLAALRLLHLSLTLPLDRLAPGEHAFGLFVAPDLRLAQQTLRYVRGVFDAVVRQARGLRLLSETETSLSFARGKHAVTLECLPATRGGAAGRGRTLIGAVLDEAAFFRDESYKVNDAEVYEALRPRVIAGGQLLLVSTPWAKAGLLYELWRDNWGRPNTCVAAHAPTSVMRDDVAILDQVEAERERDPDNAAREFDAVFGDLSSGRFFDDALLERAVSDDVTSASPGTVVTAGADLGFAKNSSALVVVYRVAEVYHVAEVLELVPGATALRPSEVFAEFSRALARHQATHVLADQYHYHALREAVAGSELSVSAAPAGQAGKADTYLRLRTLLREGRVRLPRHRRLLAQLGQVVARPTPGGGLSVTSPTTADGAHGDLASALVLAVWQASGVEVPGPEAEPGTIEFWAAEERREIERRVEARHRRLDEDGLPMVDQDGDEPTAWWED